MKVAIVHDWLTNYAGAERVVYELHHMFPKAPIYTSVYDPENVPVFKEAEVHTSFIQRIPYAKRKHQLFPVLRRKAFERFDFSEFDIVISSSGAEAKGIKTDGKTIHINYCHAPTHYYWSRYQEYLSNPAIGWIDPLAKWYLKNTIKKSRGWDYLAAQRPDYMIANSSHIQKEIKKYYERDSAVVYPPVDIDRFQRGTGKRSGFLVVGRQTHYKRIDLAVKACGELDLPLTVIGDGPMHPRLRSIAGSKTVFIRNASDKEVANHMAKAEALIFPGLDDFGITPVEAMACGTPVIAYGAGGALDSVTRQSGIHFEEQSVASLANALSHFKPKDFNAKLIRTHAEKFSAQRFRKEMQGFIRSLPLPNRRR